MESGLSFGAKLLVSVFGARRRDGAPGEQETAQRDVPGNPGETRKERDEGDAADEREDQGQG